MPNLSKRQKAAFTRWTSRKLARQSAANRLVTSAPMEPESGPDPSVEVSDVLEPTVNIDEIDIKQEPAEEAGPSGEAAMLQQDEMEIEVDLMNPTEPGSAEEELDPIGHQLWFQVKEEPDEEQETRCQFCLKQFREADGGRISIGRSKIEFVLGLREWGTPGAQPACCEGCRKMFELFYEFKRSCLVALARPTELLVCAGGNKGGASMLVDSKPAVAKKVRMVKCECTRPAGSRKKDVGGLEETSKQSRSTEKPSRKLKPEIEQPSFECDICSGKFPDRLVLKKHWLTHFFTAPKKTITKPPERAPEQESTSAVPEDQKRSCLEALARPAEDLFWAGGNNSHSNPMMMESKMKDVQLTEEFAELAEGSSSKPNSFDMQTPNTEELPANLEPDIEQPGFECEICMAKFFNGMTLKKHWLDHFSTASNNTAPNPAVPENATDLAISGADSDIPAAEPEPSTAVPEGEEQKKAYCFRCRKWFSTKTIYIHHKPYCIKHQNRPAPAFACTMCPQKFRSEQKFILHINKHNGVRTIPCRREGCTKMFFNTSNRSEHEKFCGQDFLTICNVCGSLFRSDGALRIHMATHGDPKFSCELCNKTFVKKASLKKHAATHSDERKFQCKVCGKRFKSHEANRVHQRIHTQEKPYVCHICGQRFTYNCLLKTHLEKGHETEELI